MKRLGQGIAVLVLLLIVGIAAAWINLGHIVKTQVESQGTRSLRLQTTLDSARVALFGGKLDLHGFAIAQPRGFSGDKLLQADDVGVAVSYRELRREPIHVGALVLEKPRLVIEQSGGALNFRKAMELMPVPDPHKRPLKLVIDRLEVHEAQVVIRPGLPGVKEEVVVTVPSLIMKDVGRGAGAQNGAAIKDVAMQVIAALAEKSARSGALPPQVKALLHLNAGEVAARLGAEAAKRIADAVPGEVGKAIGEEPQKLIKGLLPQGKSPR